MNLRPPGPQPGALPDCATPRGRADRSRWARFSVRRGCEHVFVRAERLRRCGGCGVEKPLSDFNWRRRERGQRDNLCRPCRAAYKQEHYFANRQRYVDQARQRKQMLAERRMRYLLDYFAEHPCADCGEDDPMVLEFDHRGDKLFDVSHALPYRAWHAILDEIAKCEVVCVNCHRRRTARRGGFMRSLMAADQNLDTGP